MSGLGVGASKKTVAIDVDSVLADVMVVWTMVYNELNNTNVLKKDITAWDIPSVLPVSPSYVYDMFSRVWKEHWKEIPPTEDKVGSVTHSIHRKGYRVSIITKRERPTVEYVAKWLDYHDVYSDDLLFIYDATPKSDYPFDVLIDDAPKNIIDIVPPKSAILFDQPWNKDFHWDVRVSSLTEADKIL